MKLRDQALANHIVGRAYRPGADAASPMMSVSRAKARWTLNSDGGTERPDRRAAAPATPWRPARPSRATDDEREQRLRIAHRPPACANEFAQPYRFPRALAIVAAGVASGGFEMGYRVAVVGATGNVGREILNILAERQFPLDEAAAVASRALDRRRDRFRRDRRETRRSRTSSISTSPAGTSPCSPPARTTSKLHVPRAAAAGCTVIDNSSLYRMDPDVPLIVPEVNPEAIAGYAKQEHHRQPQLLDRAAGGGAEAAARRGDDQARGGRDLPVGVRRRQSWNGRTVRADRATSSSATATSRSNSPSRSRSTSSRNAAISTTTARPPRNGSWWSRPRRSSIPAIKVSATCVRVPVFVGHSEAVNIEFENEISAAQARAHPARGARGDADR